MHQSQHSAALSAQPSPPLTPSPTHAQCPNTSAGQGRESPRGAASDPPSPAFHKKRPAHPVNNGNSPASPDLVIEELQTSQDKCKNRAMSIEVRLIYLSCSRTHSSSELESLFESLFFSPLIGSREGVGREEAEHGSV